MYTQSARSAVTTGNVTRELLQTEQSNPKLVFHWLFDFRLFIKAGEHAPPAKLQEKKKKKQEKW